MKKINHSVVAALFTGTLLTTMALNIYVPILPSLAVSFGASLSVVGMVSGSFGFSNLLLRIPFGLLSDRWQRRKAFIVIGSAAAVVSGLGLGFATHPMHLILWRVVGGIGGATISINAVLFAEHIRTKELGYAMGLFNFAASLALALGPMIGGWLGDAFSRQIPFMVSGLMGLLSLVVLAWLPETRRNEDESITYSLSLLRRYIFLEPFVLMMLVSFNQSFNVFTFLPLRLLEIGADKTAVGFVIFLAMLAASLAALVSGIWMPYIHGYWTVGIALVCMGIATFIVPWIRSIPGLAFSQVVCGLGWGVILPVVSSWSLTEAATHEKATSASLYLTGASLGVLLGPVTGGLIADWFNLDAAFFFVGLVGSFAALWPMAQGLRNSRRRNITTDRKQLEEIG